MAFLTSACANGITGSNSQNELGEPYSIALDELISTDAALNNKMEYISLDFGKGIPLKESDKQIIEKHLQSKYNEKIYYFSYEQLLEEELVDDQDETRLKGILLRIEKQAQSDKKNNITIEVSKYRSNEGALSAQMTLTYQDGQWEVTKHTPTRES